MQVNESCGLKCVLESCYRKYFFRFNPIGLWVITGIDCVGEIITPTANQKEGIQDLMEFM